MSQIDLPAGGELDALLAEKLFEWTIATDARDITVTVMRDGRHEERPHGRYPDAPEGSLSTIPEYSASGLYVGDILAAMLAKGFTAIIDQHATNSFSAVFHRYDYAEDDVRSVYGKGLGKTLAHAVSLAAARAVEGENLNGIERK